MHHAPPGLPLLPVRPELATLQHPLARRQIPAQVESKVEQGKQDNQHSRDSLALAHCDAEANHLILGLGLLRLLGRLLLLWRFLRLFHDLLELHLLPGDILGDPGSDVVHLFLVDDAQAAVITADAV